MKTKTNWKRLRKSTIFLVILLICYLTYTIIYSLFSFDLEDSKVVYQNSRNKNNSICTICHRVVNNKPFDEDSVFSSFSKKIYFYSKIDEKFDSLSHIWYHENEIILKQSCDFNESICVSYIKAKDLAPGLWSVDAISGNKLYGSSQFKVNAQQNQR